MLKKIEESETIVKEHTNLIAFCNKAIEEVLTSIEKAHKKNWHQTLFKIVERYLDGGPILPADILLFQQKVK